MVYEPLYHALQIWQLYAPAQSYKQAENRLFLQIKLGRILDILWAFLIKQLCHSHMLDMRLLQPTCWLSRSSHIQRKLVEELLNIAFLLPNMGFIVKRDIMITYQIFKSWKRATRPARPHAITWQLNEIFPPSLHRNRIGWRVCIHRCLDNILLNLCFSPLIK